MKKLFVILCALAVVLSLPTLATAQAKKFTLDLSGTFLTRIAGSTVPLVSSSYSSPGTGDIFTTDSVALDAWKAGGDIRLGYAWGKFGVEVRGFLLSKADQSALYTNGATSLNIAIEMNPADDYGLPPAATLTATAQDDKPLMGFEANATYDLMPKVRLFGGFRYLRLDQTYTLLGQFSSIEDDFELDTFAVTNKMLGGQVGARIDILSPADGATQGFTAQGYGAFALFSNSVNIDFVSVYGTAEPWAAASGEARKITPAVDAGFQVGYRLSSLIEFHVGYNLLWVNKVCEASRQLASLDSYPDTTADPQYKSLSVHGVKAGITVRF